MILWDVVISDIVSYFISFISVLGCGSLISDILACGSLTRDILGCNSLPSDVVGCGSLV